MSDETMGPMTAYVRGVYMGNGVELEAKARAVDAEIARLTAERDYAARVGNATADMMQEELAQAHAERDAAIVACQRISDYAGLIIKNGLKDHTFYRIERIKELADEVAAREALSMERGQSVEPCSDCLDGYPRRRMSTFHLHEGKPSPYIFDDEGDQ